jgi:hypothetical protein
MDNKGKFLKRKFLYNMQDLFSGSVCLLIWIIWVLFLIRICKVSDERGIAFLASSPFLIFGFYNLFTYLWSKKLAEKYGIEMFGDLDQDWLVAYQGYDAKVFGEIFSRRLYLKKLGAKSLYITIPLSLTPWPLLPLIIGVIMIVAYFIYRQVYYYDAMGDRWPRVFVDGIVVSRILNHRKEKNEQK